MSSLQAAELSPALWFYHHKPKGECCLSAAEMPFSSFPSYGCRSRLLISEPCSLGWKQCFSFRGIVPLFLTKNLVQYSLDPNPSVREWCLTASYILLVAARICCTSTSLGSYFLTYFIAWEVAARGFSSLYLKIARSLWHHDQTSSTSSQRNDQRKKWSRLFSHSHLSSPTHIIL